MFDASTVTHCNGVDHALLVSPGLLGPCTVPLPLAAINVGMTLNDPVFVVGDWGGTLMTVGLVVL